MRKLLMRTGALLMALATAFALQAVVAPAAHAAEVCSAPAVYGSYALRACVKYRSDGAVLGYAHVSLKAGHSDCVVRGRLASTAGWVGEPVAIGPCPNDIEISFVTPPLPSPHIGYVGTFYSAFSVQRIGDNAGPRATSPTLPSLFELTGPRPSWRQGGPGVFLSRRNAWSSRRSPSGTCTR
jgi:hypothetical protein